MRFGEGSSSADRAESLYVAYLVCESSVRGHFAFRTPPPGTMVPGSAERIQVLSGQFLVVSTSVVTSALTDNH
jgi:hypothetical protein